MTPDEFTQLQNRFRDIWWASIDKRINSENYAAGIKGIATTLVEKGSPDQQTAGRQALAALGNVSELSGIGDRADNAAFELKALFPGADVRPQRNGGRRRKTRRGKKARRSTRKSRR